LFRKFLIAGAAPALTVSLALTVVLAVATFTVGALASETQTFTYDEHGRLIEVERSGTVNDNVDTVYEYDDADNRTNEETTGGSPNPPP